MAGHGEPQVTAGAREQHRTPRREPGHGDLPGHGQDPVGVQRAGQQRAGFGQHPDPGPPGPFQLGQPGPLERRGHLVRQLLQPPDLAVGEPPGTGGRDRQHPGHLAVHHERHGRDGRRGTQPRGRAEPAGRAHAQIPVLVRDQGISTVGGRDEPRRRHALVQQDVIPGLSRRVVGRRVVRRRGARRPGVWGCAPRCAAGDVPGPGRHHGLQRPRVGPGRRCPARGAGKTHPEPDGLGVGPVADPPGGRQGGGQQQAAPAGALGGNGVVGCGAGHHPGRVTVPDHDFHRARGELAGDLDLGARVHHGVGHQLAGQQDRVIDQAAVRLGAGRSVQPGTQRIAHELAGRRDGRRLRQVRRARDEVLASLHVPSWIPR